MSQDQTMDTLLLSYVSLLTERNAYGPGEGFEYVLWDQLNLESSEMLSREERDELRFLVQRTKHWVTYNLESGKLELIDLQSWAESRGHE